MPFIFSFKDTYRQAVEAASGGRNTVMYDDKGYPSIMVCIPRFNLSDVIDDAPNTPHPAFIVDGVHKKEIWVSKFQNIVHDGRAYSLPGQNPATSLDFYKAKSACTKKGKGWHLMTNAEWAALALWSKKNETMPRGNNDYGKDKSAPYERGVEVASSDDRTTKVATGSGPASWSHDHTPFGVYDLNGNVREWVDGLRVIDGKIYVHKDNDFETSDDISKFVDTEAYFDNVGGLVLNSELSTDDPKYINTDFEGLKSESGFSVPDLLKHLAIAPTEGDHGGDRLYVNLEGERFSSRGGSWAAGSSAGVFCLHLHHKSSNTSAALGFRSSLVL